MGDWNYPTAIWFGVGRASEIPDACRNMGISNPLLVTDPFLAEQKMVSELCNQRSINGLSVEVFSRIKSNPTGTNVDDGVHAFRQNDHDGIIALGGGSALDVGKAIGLMVGQAEPLWNFEDVGDNWTRVNVENMAPVVAVPTTSGTGSEVGRASVITDETAKLKKIIFHPNMLPGLVVADPALTIGLPKHLTAATGMDALSHNMEAYFAPYFHPLAEGIAIEGMKQVKNFLPTAVKQGEDLAARSYMMAASIAGATAFQKGLGAMHALAHSLGALYDAHHGLLNAILMPYVLEANRTAITHPAKQLAHALELENGLDGVIQWILQLRREIGIPNTLQEIGLDAIQMNLVGEMAAVDPSAGGNPIKLTSSEYGRLFENAIIGELNGIGR